MVEPHVFCGPEFVLEVPAARVAEVLTPADVAGAIGDGGSTSSTRANTSATAWTVPAATLVQMQSELYGVCTLELRWRLHRPTVASAEAAKAIEAGDVRAVASLMTPYMGEAGGGGHGQHHQTAAPAAPTDLRFLVAKATNAVTAEEEASLAQTAKVVARASAATADTATADTRAATENTSSSTSPSVHVLILITDSRMASELYMLCLRNTSIALSKDCRLHNYYRATARAAAVDPTDILAKKEAARARRNLDSDLWSALELAVTPELVEQVVTQRQRADEENHRYPPGRLLTAREAHQQRVDALLSFCEARVTYAGVLDGKEEASPLLVAMGLFFRLRLTEWDLYRSFARHPRRAVRALALLLARYLLPAEEVPPFFYAALHDEVVIATSEDGNNTCTMAEFAAHTLTKDEVGEAWLPLYHPFYAMSVVAPAMTRMTWLWEQHQQSRQQRQNGQGVADTGDSGTGDDGELEEDGVPKLRDATEGEDQKTSHDNNGGLDDIRGAGRGVAALGFKSLQALGAYVRQQERALVPQRMTTLLAARHTRRRDREEVFALLDSEEEDREGNRGRDRRRRRAGSDAGSSTNGQRSEAEDDDDDDDFLIHVAVSEEAGAGKGGSGSEQLARVRELGHRDRSRAAQQRPSSRGTGAATSAADAVSAAALSAKRRREEERLDPHAAIRKEGYRVVLELLGRRQPFNRKDERYLEF